MDLCQDDEILLANGNCVDISRLLAFQAALDTKTVFISSTLHDGALGGLAGADEICNQRAQEAGLFGTYKAWLSDSTGSPSTRFTRSLIQSYVRTDGVQVADDFIDLTDASLDNAIERDETGTAVPFVPYQVWTGTNANASARAGQSCSNWSSNSATTTGHTGQSNRVNDDWTSAWDYGCDVPRRLYCFEQ